MYVQGEKLLLMIVVCTAMIIAMMEAHQVIFVAPLTLMIVQE